MTWLGFRGEKCLTPGPGQPIRYLDWEDMVWISRFWGPSDCVFPDVLHLYVKMQGVRMHLFYMWRCGWSDAFIYNMWRCGWSGQDTGICGCCTWTHYTNQCWFDRPSYHATRWTLFPRVFVFVFVFVFAVEPCGFMNFPTTGCFPHARDAKSNKNNRDTFLAKFSTKKA